MTLSQHILCSYLIYFLLTSVDFNMRIFLILNVFHEL